MLRNNPPEIEVLRAILGFVIIGHCAYWLVKLILWLV
jgi:hypothetical protein